MERKRLTAAILQMDPDQDLLDLLDRQEGFSTSTVTALIIGFSLAAAVVLFFTLRLELHSTADVSLDGAGLFALASAVAVYVAYRKMG